jgi:hypothetical protein
MNATPPPESLSARVGAVLAQHLAPKPWNQFFSGESFAKPLQMSTASTRAGVNLRLYASNYVILAASCTAFVFLLSPLMAIAVAAGVAGAVLYKVDFRGVASHIDNRTAYGTLAVYSLIVMVLTPLAEMVLIGAGFAAAACTMHAVMHEAPESFSST